MEFFCVQPVVRGICLCVCTLLCKLLFFFLYVNIIDTFQDADCSFFRKILYYRTHVLNMHGHPQDFFAGVGKLQGLETKFPQRGPGVKPPEADEKL